MVRRAACRVTSQDPMSRCVPSCKSKAIRCPSGAIRCRVKRPGVGRNIWVLPCRSNDSSGRPLPDPGSEVHECARVRERNLRFAARRVRQHVFDNRDRRSRHLQTFQVERRREQRLFMDVGEVTARKISAVKSASMYNRGRAAVQWLHDDAGVIEIVRRAVRRIENGAASRQRLREAVRDLTLRKCRQWFARAAVRRHPEQPTAVLREDDRAVVQPRAAA